MDKRSRLLFNIIIYFSLLFTLASVVGNNKENVWQLFILSLLLLVSFTMRRKIEYSYLKFKHWGKLALFLDIALIFTITLLDAGETSQIYFYSLISDAMVLYFFRFSVLFSAASYISYIVIIYVRYTKNNYFDLAYFSPIVIDKSFYFIFIFGVMYIASYQINQKMIFNKTMEELEVKTEQLEETNRKLHETMNALEEMTALKERNRIAREIHDTVGHTLTTVLIEMEAGKRLIRKDTGLAMEKLELAQGQVRKGLNDIRQSVRTLKDGSDIVTFLPSLNLLVQETEKHTGVSVKCILLPLPPLSHEQEKVLYSALQEGLTNGIRHGQGTAFVFKLRHNEGYVHFSLEDNGLGCGSINLGFGLTAMKERVEKLGGCFDIKSVDGEGCCLTIKIPAKKEISHEDH